MSWVSCLAGGRRDVEDRPLLEGKLRPLPHEVHLLGALMQMIRSLIQAIDIETAIEPVFLISPCIHIYKTKIHIYIYIYIYD